MFAAWGAISADWRSSSLWFSIRKRWRSAPARRLLCFSRRGLPRFWITGRRGSGAGAAVIALALMAAATALATMASMSRADGALGAAATTVFDSVMLCGVCCDVGAVVAPSAAASVLPVESLSSGDSSGVSPSSISSWA